MRLFLTLLAALFFWGLVITTFSRLWRRRRGMDSEKLALMVWLITLLLGTSMTLHVDPVQAAIGMRTGMPNFGWYLAYVIGSTGMYLIGLIVARSYETNHKVFILLLRILFGMVLLAYTWLYTGWILHTFEWTARSPRDWPEMLFLVTFFGFAGVAASYWLVPLIQAWQRQHDKLMRVRTLFGMAVCAFSLTCFSLKIAYAVLGYVYGDSPFMEVINQLALLAMAGVSVVLVPLLVSHRTYIRIQDIFSLPSKLQLLYELRDLQHRLDALCPGIMWEKATWWGDVRRPDFYIYRSMVSILDSERMLSGYLERLDRSGNLTLFVADRTGEMRLWDPNSVRAARQIRASLHIPADADYPQLLSYLRQASQRLGKE
jgi:hypothetical protein